MFFEKKMVFTPFKTSLFFCLAACTLISGILLSCKSGSSDSDEKLEMDGTEKAMRQQFLMTRDPALDQVPTERLLAAMRFMRNMRTTQVSNLTWSERGPNNIGGRSRAIMIDKKDPSGNSVFAASVSGGIFKTTNFLSGTPNWTVVNDQMANLAVTVLVQDRNNFNTMYAGTGEGWFNLDAVRGAGIFKSIDGGTTWNQIPSTSTFEYVQDLVIDNNGNLYVALRNLTSSNRGVMRSTDGGVTWTQVLGLQQSDPSPCPGVTFTTGRAADLEVASNGDIYASLGIFTPTQIFKSSFATYGANTGAKCNWQEVTPPHAETTFRAEVAVAPSNSQRVYVMMQDSATDQVLRIYRSNDGGATWGNFAAPTALNNGSNSQTWYDLISAVDSTNADVVVVGGIQLARSTDGGVTWSNITTSATVHVDQHALVFLNSSTLLVGNDGGIYASTNFTAASPTFIQKNNGFNATQFYGCDFHPTDPDYFLAGAQDNNTQQFTLPGINSTTPVVGGDGGIPHIRQTDGVLQIAATTNNNYYRSLNSGVSFSSLGANNNHGQFINASDLDNAQNILYAGDDTTHFYRVTNLDGTPVGNSLRVSGMGTRGVTAVKIDPFSPNTVWLGCSVVDESTSNLPPLILKVTNANTTPTVSLSRTISAGLDPSGAQAYISSIDVDPANENNLLVTLSNFGVQSVYESTDGGSSWTSLDNNGVNLPDMPVLYGIFAPTGAQLSGTTGGGIILGTALGVWTASTISGNTTPWIPNNNGLANVPVYMIRYRPANTSLVVATHGRGLFTAPLTGVVTSVSNNVITKDFIKYISADVNQLLVVKGNLNTVKMQVQIYDAAGKLLYNKTQPYQNLSIPISTWSKGTYVIKMQGNNKENFVRQFVKY